MKIAVIGANSFSGQNFVAYALAQDEVEQVIGLSRRKDKLEQFITIPKFHWLYHDLSYNPSYIIEILDTYKPNWIINFAAQSVVQESWKSPEDWYKTNVVGIAQLLPYLSKVPYLKRFLQISSPEVYGSTDYWPVLENFPAKPSTPYAASKLAIDTLLNIFYNKCGLPVVFARSVNVYGKYQQLFKIIPKTIIKLKRNEKIKLHGGGKVYRNFIHISDVSRAEWTILKNGLIGETYHIAPQSAPISIRTLTSIVCEQMRANPKDFIEDTDERFGGEDEVYCLNSEKIRHLGWHDIVELEDGIQEVIEWINNLSEDYISENFEYKHNQ